MHFLLLLLYVVAKLVEIHAALSLLSNLQSSSSGYGIVVRKGLQ